MTAANEDPARAARYEDPARAARYDERAEVAELAARVAYENGQASDDQMRAYARQESDAPLPPSREQASIDEEPVASTQKVRKVVAPLPPVRPAQSRRRPSSFRSQRHPTGAELLGSDELSGLTPRLQFSASRAIFSRLAALRRKYGSASCRNFPGFTLF